MILIKKFRRDSPPEYQAIFDCAGVGIGGGSASVYIERVRGSTITVMFPNEREAAEVFHQICEAQGHSEKTVTIEVDALCVFEDFEDDE